ncbi:MAG: ribosomal RNA small subunit methyltransferase A [Anaerolineales bacterium]|nr:ribosomal RNA small subunit methyltransferase A [Anaerolineales bacterium]
MSQPLQQSVSAILNKHGLLPDKSLGQNFLTDPNILEKITSIAGVTEKDSVLEIGAGLGHLTAQLARSAKQVAAVELDERFIPVLEENLAEYENIRIIQGDILSLNPQDLVQQNNYLVVANIPYYITSRIIRNLLESELKPIRITLTIQYEVAQRVCARTGKMSLLSLSVLMYGEPSLEMRIPAGAFFPPPKVDSAVVLVNLYPEPLLKGEMRERFFEIIKAGFLHKRKTLRNSLSKGLAWSPDDTENLLVEAGIDPQRRAETLTMEEWLELTRNYDKIHPPQQLGTN